MNAADHQTEGCSAPQLNLINSQAKATVAIDQHQPHQLASNDVFQPPPIPHRNTSDRIQPQPNIVECSLLNHFASVGQSHGFFTQQYARINVIFIFLS